MVGDLPFPGLSFWKKNVCEHGGWFLCVTLWALISVVDELFWGDFDFKAAEEIIYDVIMAQ